MLQSQRIDMIIQHLNQRGTLSVQELLAMFGVSRETIRRDLQKMESQGLVTKVRGGLKLQTSSHEPPYSRRSTSNLAQKQAIARAALELVSDGDTLYIDSGTTTLEFARLLGEKRRLSIFTNSLPVATMLAEKQTDIYLIGGLLRRGELSLSGALGELSIGQFYADKAFVGAGGVSPELGLTDYHIEEAALRRIVLARASQGIVLADSSKFGTRALAHVVPFGEVAALVTDADRKRHV